MSIWETCEAVERMPGKVSGAWVFRGTRLPLSHLFEHLASGASVDDFLDRFDGVDQDSVRAVFGHLVEVTQSEVTTRLDAVYARESSELPPALQVAQHRALVESW